MGLINDKEEIVRNATLNILKHDFLYYVAVGKTFRGKMHTINPSGEVHELS